MPSISQGEVSYITGAASGIGRALASMLVGQGGRVCIVDLNGEAGAKFASDLNKKAGSLVAIAVQADTTVWEQQLAAFEKAKQAFKRIDYGLQYFYWIIFAAISAHLIIVFANAGIAERPWLAPFDPITAASRPITKPDLSTANINLTGQLYTASIAFQTFERQEVGPSGFRGKLILTASVFAFYPSRAMPMYAASKAAIVNFMRSAAQYYADKNITVNAVAPNLTETAIAPEPLYAAFRETGILTGLDLVVEQFQKCLGDSKINGQALAITQETVWSHPAETHMFKENNPACELISVQLFKLFGDKTA
ncbi:NAD-P-binding protein [Mycena rebaudengoi]|nr:NAD-P-binding protein [Mycena rebaudengoi]